MPRSPVLDGYLRFLGDCSVGPNLNLNAVNLGDWVRNLHRFRIMISCPKLVALSTSTLFPEDAGMLFLLAKSDVAVGRLKSQFRSATVDGPGHKFVELDFEIAACKCSNFDLAFVGLQVEVR